MSVKGRDIAHMLQNKLSSIFGFEKRNKDMYLLIGLGNPGLNYAKTRHNAGFMVIDRLAEDYNINVNKFKHKAFVGEGSILSKKVMLVKPQTFMNLSGESVREIIRFYKIPIENVLIIYDDISLVPGITRIRKKGSAGGHNGIKNIISHLGNDVFDRVKVGVGEKPNGWDLGDYVTSKISEDDMATLNIGISRACEATKLWLSEGVEKAMNETNQKNLT